MKAAATAVNSSRPCSKKKKKSNCLAQVIIFTNTQPSSLKRAITGKDNNNNLFIKQNSF